MSIPAARIHTARGLILLVIISNLQAAAAFLISPELYSPGFEVAGVAGATVVRGFAILFLMWNVPYVFAMINPVQNRTSVYEAILMQGIGLVGESFLLLALPDGHTALRQTALRFIGFDGAGLVLLCIAALITRKNHPR